MSNRESDQNAPFERERIAAPEAGERPAAQEPSLTATFNALLSDAQALLRKEIALARQETLDTVNTVRSGAIVLGAGAGLAAAGGILLLLALARGLSAGLELPLWLSYLIVGGILAAVGAIAAVAGVGRIRQADPVPRATIDSLRQDVEWVKEHTPPDRHRP